MADPANKTIPSEDSPTGGDGVPDLMGKTLGDFEISRLIGAGGMGAVYLARQKSLKRQVAIKVLRSDLAANTTALRRFQAEAEAVASITHANIVQVHAIGESEGLHYMALEYVDGRNLRDFLEKKGTPDLPVALEIIRQVASALERAGELGFVHRDIKPENILLSKKGEIKVTDFGLSRCFGTDVPVNITASGVMMGTPLYMSPEQVRGQTVDPRSDIYSLGVTCYHMLAGEPPFQGSTAFDVALQHVQNDPRRLSDLRPDLPPDFVGLVHKMMAKRPEDRHQSAREILADLAKLQAGQSLNLLGSNVLPGLFTSMAGNSGFSAQPTQSMNSGGIAWGVSSKTKWIVFSTLAITSVAAGALTHRFLNPPAPAIDPKAALVEIEPPPSVTRERELRKLINDKTVKIEVATDGLLELAMICIRDQRHEEALKLFDADAIRKLGAFEEAIRKPNVYRDPLHIMSLAGRGIVLAWQDKTEASVDEFQKLIREYPLPPKSDKAEPKVKAVLNRGQLEGFFIRNTTGPTWRKAVNEALDRNAKNLGGKLPDGLSRLRFLPAKTPPIKG